MEILKRELREIEESAAKEGLKAVLAFNAKSRYMRRNYPANSGSRCCKCMVYSKIGDTITWHWSGYLFHLQCVPTEV